MLRVRIFDKGVARAKVTVNLPMALADLLFKSLPEEAKRNLRLKGYDAESLRVVWPALAARASVVMDRRGTHRAAEFTIRGATGGAIQLSGGVEIVMRRDHMLLRRVPARGQIAPASRLVAPAGAQHGLPEARA